jgi:hypothetical protein
VRRALALVLAAQLAAPFAGAPAARAQADGITNIAPGVPASGLSTSEELSGSARGNEYISGNYPGAVLMPVNLWGAVHKPGIHHVPTQTDILNLVSYAGGPSERAELDRVAVKRRVKDQDTLIEYDLKKALSEPVKTPVLRLEPNDIVFIPPREDGLSPSTMKTVIFISTVVGIVLTGLLISDHFKDSPTR